jgi:hypothetical protein
MALEFPKMVYKAEAPVVTYITVDNADEEDAAASEGYGPLNEVQPEVTADTVHKQGPKQQVLEAAKLKKAAAEKSVAGQAKPKGQAVRPQPDDPYPIRGADAARASDHHGPSR